MEQNSIYIIYTVTKRKESLMKLFIKLFIYFCLVHSLLGVGLMIWAGIIGEFRAVYFLAIPTGLFALMLLTATSLESN